MNDSFFELLLKVAMITLVLVGGLWGLQKLLAQRLPGRQGEQKLVVVERTVLAPGKFGVLVRIRGREYFVVLSERAVAVTEVGENFATVLQGEVNGDGG